jgi:hypothetical protein
MSIIDQQKYGVSWVINSNESNMLALFQLESPRIIHLCFHFSLLETLLYLIEYDKWLIKSYTILKFKMIIYNSSS